VCECNDFNDHALVVHPHPHVRKKLSGKQGELKISSSFVNEAHDVKWRQARKATKDLEQLSRLRPRATRRNEGVDCAGCLVDPDVGCVATVAHRHRVDPRGRRRVVNQIPETSKHANKQTNKTTHLEVQKRSCFHTQASLHWCMMIFTSQTSGKLSAVPVGIPRECEDSNTV